MIDLITAYLLQKKTCDLPGVGKFMIQAHKPELDFAAKKIYPPQNQVIYVADATEISPGLIQYISRIKEMSEKNAKSEIEQWCEQAKRKIQLFGAVEFAGLGKLQKSVTGSIFFQRDNFIPAYDEVQAEKVIHKDEPHSLLVGDTITNSQDALAQYEQEEIIENKKWMWMAAVLLLIGLFILVYHFFITHSSDWGIQNHILSK